MTTGPIVVAGAGIGGLTTAIALSAQGFDIVVLEQAAQLAAVGAGLQLSPNASHVLIALGLEPLITPRATRPTDLIVNSARRGALARLRLGSGSDEAPYWVIHRGDLQDALLAAVRARSNIDLRPGCTVEQVSPGDDRVTVDYVCGGQPYRERATAVIGADGIRSRVRTQLFPQSSPAFSGFVAWRTTVDADEAPVNGAHVELWMDAQAHLVIYPIANGRTINLVAIVRDRLDPEPWDTPGQAAAIRTAFASRWPPHVQVLIDRAIEWRRWPLFTLPANHAWASGRVALLGDAAHAMLPFAAQGAGMAIEDAAVLAPCISDGMDDIPTALARYAQQRRARVMRVQDLAGRNGRIYHLAGPLALARDLVIRALGERLMRRQDWIYDWRP